MLNDDHYLEKSFLNVDVTFTMCVFIYAVFISVGNRLYLAKSINWSSEQLIIDENRVLISGYRMAYSDIFSFNTEEYISGK